MPIIDVTDLCFSYPDHDVLKNVTFALERGDFLGVIGSNGSGKSTLIKLILGLLEPTSGNVLIEHDEHIGYVSQKATSFNPSFPATVLEVVASGVPTNVKKQERIKMATNAIASVGLTEKQDKLIGRLSGGQQQRVFIARAIVSKPGIIILDEPTVGVDTASVKVITDLIKSLNKTGMTVIMTNHDTHSLETIANKLLTINDNGTIKISKKIVI